MNNTNLTIRIDSNLKKEADNLFKELGINISSAITLFLKQSVREKALPFDVAVKEEKPSREMKKLLKEIKNIEEGKSKLYDNLDELWKDLKI